jgi:hypothetical protein
LLTVSPNPITSTATLKLPAGDRGRVFLRIYDIKGEKIADLSDQAESNPMVSWDARNLPNGIYLVQAGISGNRSMQKLLVQR